MKMTEAGLERLHAAVTQDNYRALHLEPLDVKEEAFCGCALFRNTKGRVIFRLCPLHEAAPALLEALEGSVATLENAGEVLFYNGCEVTRGRINETLDNARDAIKLARGDNDA